MNDLIPLVRPLADHRRIRIDYMASTQKTEQHVLADEKLLRQVMLNLLSNAIKYNYDGGQVRIACRDLALAENRMNIVVSDTGPGIAQEKLGRLFSPLRPSGYRAIWHRGQRIGSGVVQTVDGGTRRRNQGWSVTREREVSSK